MSTEKKSQAESVSTATLVETFQQLTETLKALHSAVPNPQKEAEETAARLTAPDRMDQDGTIKPPFAMDVLLLDGTQPHRWQITAKEIETINRLFEKKIHGRFADRRIQVIHRDDPDGTCFEIRKHSPSKIASGEYISYFATFAPTLVAMLENIEKEWHEQRKERAVELKKELEGVSE